MTKSKAWTAEEIDASIGLYLCMRCAVHMAKKVNKRALIREQQEGDPLAVGDAHGPLMNRSRGSIEMKLMNITACLIDLGRDDLSMAEHGYRPLSSYQAALRARVGELVDGVSVLDIYDTASSVVA